MQAKTFSILVYSQVHESVELEDIIENTKYEDNRYSVRLGLVTFEYDQITDTWSVIPFKCQPYTAQYLCLAMAEYLGVYG